MIFIEWRIWQMLHHFKIRSVLFPLKFIQNLQSFEIWEAIRHKWENKEIKIDIFKFVYSVGFCDVHGGQGKVISNRHICNAYTHTHTRAYKCVELLFDLWNVAKWMNLANSCQALPVFIHSLHSTACMISNYFSYKCTYEVQCVNICL